MKLRNSGTWYYIHTIKGYSVEKIQNVNSRGLVLKNLKDIYEAQCSRHLHHTINYSCLPMAKRVKVETECQGNISECSGNIYDIASGLDDLSFGEITLKQIKERCKTKKRKKLDVVCLSLQKELAQSLPDQDDCHLTTPLSSWNVQLSKCSKSKKMPTDCAPIGIKVEVSPICFPQLESAGYGSTKAGYGSSSYDEQLNLSHIHSTKLCQTSDTTLENDQVMSLAGQFETCVLNENCYTLLDDDFIPVSFLPPLIGNTQGPTTHQTCQHPSVYVVSESQKEAEIIQLPCRKSFSLIDKSVCENRLVISSQSSNDMQEISGHGTRDQDSDVPLENCTDIVYGNELCILEDNAITSSNMFKSSRYCYGMPEIFNNESGCLVSSVETDYSIWCTKTGGGIKLSVFEVIKSNIYQHLADNFLRSPFCYYGSPWTCYPFSASDSDLFTPENDACKRSLISDNSLTARNCLKPKNYLTFLEDSSYANKEKQSLLPVNTDAEISFSSDAVNHLSTPETNNHYEMVSWQPPKRFHLKRKVISPTSQKKLCLTMSSRDLSDDIDNYKCKGKLFFGNQTEDSILSVASDTADGKSCMTDESTGKLTLTKAIFGPKKILKKQKCKKGSPPKRCFSPKGHIEGPTKKGSPPKGRLTRSIPGLCSGRIAIEACREGMVTFSRRQMQDIESLAVKLMTELKSMKNIIEQKILNEAYHRTSTKNDTNEVKLAIKNATRVEERTKKWLSMMSRDCNRFYKIMSELPRSTEDFATGTESIMHKKKKKISFADEAGGVLCHVKYFENYKNNTEVTS